MSGLRVASKGRRAGGQEKSAWGNAMNWMHLAILTLVAAVAVLPGAATAQRVTACDEYAATAVAQNQSNIGQGCGYGGPGWSDDYDSHLAWCQQHGVSREDVGQETSNRAEALDFCADRAIACDAYASLAVAQNQANIAKGCGLTGGRWSADYAGHRQWCMSVRPQYSADEVAIRDSALGQCGGELSAIELQQIYQAQQKTLQMLSNIVKRMSDTSNSIIQNIQ